MALQTAVPLRALVCDVNTVISADERRSVLFDLGRYSYLSLSGRVSVLGVRGFLCWKLERKRKFMRDYSNRSLLIGQQRSCFLRKFGRYSVTTRE